MESQIMACKNPIKFLSIVLSILLFTLSFPLTAFAAEQDMIESEYENSVVDIDPDDEFEDDKILVTFKKEYSDPEVEVTKDDFPGINIANIENYIISDPDENFTRDITITLAEHNKSEVVRLCNEISQREDVLLVYPSYIKRVESYAVPNDPEYSNNVAPYTLIHAAAAWNTTTGSSNVKVAVIDTKVDKHVDFDNNLVTGYDANDGSTITNDAISDHGTNVASIIGAKGNNGKYSTGVCWNVSVVPIQFKSFESEDHRTIIEVNNDVLNKAFSYMKQNNITIANCSFGGFSIKTPTDAYFEQKVKEWGGILVCSAGNDSADTDKENSKGEKHYPSTYDCDNIVSVAAYNPGGTGLASFSNFGAETVDIAAPGESIYVLKNTTGAGIGGGTSFAAPFVTGAAALLKSKYSDATAEEIIQALKAGCVTFDWTNGKVKYGCLKIDRSLQKLKEIIEHRKTINDGTYIIGAANNSFQVMDIVGSSTANSAATRFYEANGSNSQKFEIKYHENDLLNYYTIKNVNSGKYLEAAGGSTAAGIAVQQNTWNGTDSQKWIIKSVSDGVYRIVNQKSGLSIDFGTSIPSNGQTVKLQTTANNAKQQFRFVSSGKKLNITDGVYKISNTYSLSLSAVSGNVELASNADYFSIVNKEGYCYITRFFGNKVVSCTNDSSSGYDNVLTAEEDETSDNQKWIIKDGGDGNAYIVSYASGKVFDIENAEATVGSNIILSVTTGKDSQRFSIQAVSANEFSKGYIDKYYYVLDENETRGVDISNGIFYDISESSSPNYHVALIKADYGLYKIEDVISKRFLEMNSDGTVAFAAINNEENQLWKLTIDSSGVWSLLNVYSEKYLKYAEDSDGNLLITSCVNMLDDSFSNLVFKKYASIQSGVKYLIVPKTAPEKALTSGDFINQTDISLTFDNIDSNDSKQMFTFEADDITDERYYIKNDSTGLKIDLKYYLPRTGFLSNSEWTYSVAQDDEGYYEIRRNDRHLIYNDNHLCTPKDANFNKETAKFMLIPVSDEIDIGTYQILIGDNQSKALSVDSSMDSNQPISIQTANSKDVSQLFYLYKDEGGYKFVNMYSGKVLSLADDLSSLIQTQNEADNMLQRWQIINSNKTDSDYSAEILSYRTGNYLWNHEERVSTVYYDGNSDQKFVLKRVYANTVQERGEIVSSSDSTKDMSISGEAAVLSSIPDNGRKTLELIKDVTGLWQIVDRDTENVLDCADGALAFNPTNSSETQNWIVNKMPDGSKIIINVASGKMLKNTDGVLTLNNCDCSQTDGFHIYFKGDLNFDGKFNSLDLLLIRKCFSGEYDASDEVLYCADINDDGRLTVLDLTLLQHVISGTSESSQQDASLNAYAINTMCAMNGYPIDKDIAEMSDEEFLRYMFGDIDYEAFEITYFD